MWYYYTLQRIGVMSMEVSSNYRCDAYDVHSEVCCTITMLIKLVHVAGYHSDNCWPPRSSMLPNSTDRIPRSAKRGKHPRIISCSSAKGIDGLRISTQKKTLCSVGREERVASKSSHPGLYTCRGRVEGSAPLSTQRPTESSLSTLVIAGFCK